MINVMLMMMTLEVGTSLYEERGSEEPVTYKITVLGAELVHTHSVVSQHPFSLLDYVIYLLLCLILLRGLFLFAICSRFNETFFFFILK